MSKDERFLINNNMRLQSKQFCVAFYKRDVLPGKLLYWEAKKEGALQISDTLIYGNTQGRFSRE